MTLDDDDVEAIAERVALKLLAGGAQRALVDVAAIARMLGVSVDYVYGHAAELGGVRLGTGPKARWRFDPRVAATALGGPSSGQPQCAPTPAQKRRGSSGPQPRSSDLIELRGRADPRTLPPQR
jgi:hypothetical protein